MLFFFFGMTCWLRNSKPLIQSAEEEAFPVKSLSEARRVNLGRDDRPVIECADEEGKPKEESDVLSFFTFRLVFLSPSSLLVEDLRVRVGRDGFFVFVGEDSMAADLITSRRDLLLFTLSRGLLVSSKREFADAILVSLVRRMAVCASTKRDLEDDFLGGTRRSSDGSGICFLSSCESSSLSTLT